jgi:hypothetical protein
MWRPVSWPQIAPADPDEPPRALTARLLWMAAIWAASVVAMLALALVLRLLLL